MSEHFLVKENLAALLGVLPEDILRSLRSDLLNPKFGSQKSALL